MDTFNHQQPPYELIAPPPAVIMVSQAMNYGPKKQNCVCPHCHNQIRTSVTTKMKTKSHFWALCLCLFLSCNDEFRSGTATLRLLPLRSQRQDSNQNRINDENAHHSPNIMPILLLAVRLHTLLHGFLPEQEPLLPQLQHLFGHTCIVNVRTG